MIGSVAASAFCLNDTEDREGIWFVLQDLSVRLEGSYRYVDDETPTTDRTWLGDYLTDIDFRVTDSSSPLSTWERQVAAKVKRPWLRARRPSWPPASATCSPSSQPRSFPVFARVLHLARHLLRKVSKSPFARTGTRVVMMMIVNNYSEHL